MAKQKSGATNGAANGVASDENDVMAAIRDELASVDAQSTEVKATKAARAPKTPRTPKEPAAKVAKTPADVAAQQNEVPLIYVIQQLLALTERRVAVGDSYDNAKESVFKLYDALVDEAHSFLAANPTTNTHLGLVKFLEANYPKSVRWQHRNEMDAANTATAPEPVGATN